MHSYSVMCDKKHRNNYIRGRNICDEVYKESYNVCVTMLKNDNKISVNVAGYSVCALLDTGSTISTINWELHNKIKQTTKLVVNDVRKLNDKTILQPYPMLNMNYLLADIGKRKCKYFSLIDLSDSYRQIPLTKRSQQIATMSTIIGDFSPTICIFGLKNLPFVFTRLMDKIFSSIRGKYMEFFLDDIIIYSTTFEEHVCHILRIHVTSPILGERISAITLTQQRKQWLSVELNRWRSERIHYYFFNNKNRTLIIMM